MEEKDAIINRVARSPLMTFDLEEYYHPGERVQIDMKEYLHEGLILREKEFREKLSSADWEKYRGKNISIICSAEAIIPSWAYMLIATKLSGFAHMAVFGDFSLLENALFYEALKSVDIEKYRDQKVVIKGCGKYAVPQGAYVEITRLLTPVVSSLMYGEPCSTVPLFKRSGA